MSEASPEFLRTIRAVRSNYNKDWADVPALLAAVRERYDSEPVSAGDVASIAKDLRLCPEATRSRVATARATRMSQLLNQARDRREVGGFSVEWAGIHNSRSRWRVEVSS